jgi:protein-disulfide isomerase
MASRKQQKEQARAQRLEQERRHAAQATQRRRYMLFGGVIVAAVVIIGVAIAISAGGGGSSPTGLQHGHHATQTFNQVDHLLSGIPQHGTTLGNPHAPVTMTYFGDLQCPICRDFTLNSLPQFIQDQIRPGKVKMTYRSFCTASCNNQSVSNPQGLFNTQQVAAYAAGKQNLFWYYAELFYHQQGTENTAYVTPAFLNGLAIQIPMLHLTTWHTDRGDPALLSQVQADEQAAAAQSLTGTPTLIMSGAKGSETVQGSGGSIPSYSDLAAAVQAVQ